MRSEVGQFVGLLHEWLLRPKTASLVWLIVYCSSVFCLSSLFFFFFYLSFFQACGDGEAYYLSFSSLISSSSFFFFFFFLFCLE